MVWQDIGFGIASVLLSIVLIPQFVDVLKLKIRINIATGLLTGSVLGCMAIMYGTLGLPIASITSWVTAGMWVIMSAYSQDSNR